jgi:hypothetical protein
MTNDYSLTTNLHFIFKANDYSLKIKIGGNYIGNFGEF